MIIVVFHRIRQARERERERDLSGSSSEYEKVLLLPVPPLSSTLRTRHLNQLQAAILVVGRRR
jgi:hypothetical protein